MANAEYIFWTFSAAAQSIAAFVALLLAGYALVHQLMAAARRNDDSLEEIHESLQDQYHRRLVLQAWVTGAAIIGSLAIVYTNSMDFAAWPFLVAVVAAVDLAAIVAGLSFAVSIVNPGKYRRAATKELEQTQELKNDGAQPVSVSVFFHAFLELEKAVRDYLKERGLYVPSRGAPRMSNSFRQMIDALLYNEIISDPLHKELLEVNKSRNLVFHGHVENVNAAMVDRVRRGKVELEGAFNAA